MSQYYLIAQLPGLEPYEDGKSPLPITEKEFRDACSSFLSEKELEILDGISLIPPREARPTGSELVDAWNREERELRLALAATRASHKGKSFSVDGEVISAPALQAANTAVDLGDPLAAEEYLQSCRMETLDRLRPMDMFCEDAVYCYAIRLKLLTRMRLFDEERGHQSYQNIYHSILNGNSQEN
ncbi:MAG: hypothetical protein LIO86_15275 [Lachnospiraceae bacterium]|nr:hypothetical protein [Lachnospiraceae bacterium]